MILKNLAAMCRKQRVIIMYHDRSDMQWISEGHAIYPMVGIPEVDEEQVMFLFDIPEKKRAECLVSDYGSIEDCFDISDGAMDNEVKLMPPAMMIGGNLITPIETSQGIAFFNSEYLKPVSDKEDLNLYERYTRNGQLYIVAKSGMIVQAVILPVKLEENGKKLMERLTAIIGMLKAQVEQEDE